MAYKDINMFVAVRSIEDMEVMNEAIVKAEEFFKAAVDTGVDSPRLSIKAESYGIHFELTGDIKPKDDDN